jgi:hypothetical protein
VATTPILRPLTSPYDRRRVLRTPLCQAVTLEPDRCLTHSADLVFGKGWKIYFLWGSIGLIAFVYSLASMTTYTCKRVVNLAARQLSETAFASH